MASTHRRSWLPVAGIAVVGVALTYFAYDLSRRAQSETASSALELRAEWRAKDFAHKIETFATLPLNAVVAFVNTFPALTASQFKAIAEQARDDTNPILMILWTPRVPSADRSQHEAELSAATGTDYRILERTPDGTISAAGHRNEYFPARFIAAFESRPNLIGFDVAYSASRRAAADAARDQGRPVATPPVLLAGSPNSGHSYLVFYPVYDGTVPPSVEERREKLRGYVVGVFRFHEVLQAAIEGTPEFLSNVYFLLDDGSADHHGHLPVATYDLSHKRFVPRAPVPTLIWPSGLTIERELTALNQGWHLVFQFPVHIVDGLHNSSDEAVLALGVLMTVLLAAFVHRERQRILVAEGAASRSTADLTRAHREQEAIIDASLLAIIVLDAEYIVRVWNPAATRIFGFEAAEVVGKPYPLVPVEGRAEFDAMFARVRSGVIIRDMEVRRVRKDGALVDVAFSGVPLYDAAAKFRGALFTLEDVSERKAIQQQLAQAQKMEAVGQLTGGIAHDFNNVLGAVIGNLDLVVLKLQGQSEPLEIVSDALDAALRGSDLVQRLLAFSRKQPLQPRPIDVRTALDELGPLLRRSLGERITVDADIADDILLVKADPVQLQNAILNLAINARDAMPQGGKLTIEAQNFELDEAFAPIYPDLRPGAYVAISVGDTGTGISPDILHRVFEPFFSTKGVGRGTGLGLSMVYGTLKQSGGSVKIYSEVGKGTTVRLFLPRAMEDALTPDAVSPAGGETLPVGGEHILLVEDNPEMRKVANGILTGLGYSITEVQSADAALQVLLEGKAFDLVFSDVVMPGTLDGLGLAREVRRLWPSLPVLLTSGFSSKVVAGHEIQALNADFIVKPYRRAELAHKIHRALDRIERVKVA